jgi:hypothetical protein
LSDHQVDYPLPEVDDLSSLKQLRDVVAHFEQGNEENYLRLQLIYFTLAPLVREIGGYFLHELKVWMGLLMFVRFPLACSKNFQKEQYIFEFNDMRQFLSQVGIMTAYFF